MDALVERPISLGSAIKHVASLFYCDNAGLLAMVACETPLLHTSTAPPVVRVRDKLRVLCHEKQRSIVAWASIVGLGIVFQRQPSTPSRKAAVGHDLCHQAFENLPLTPVSRHHANMPTNRFVQLAIAPLLPAARACGPACRVPDPH